MNERNHTGYLLAAGASIMLLADGVAMLATLTYVLAKAGSPVNLPHLFQNSGLPLAVYAIWALGIFGTVGAIAAITLYGFRARWFWRCLFITACLWLAFPPIHMIIGLLSLIFLLRYRRAFPLGREPLTAAP